MDFLSYVGCQKFNLLLEIDTLSSKLGGNYTCSYSYDIYSLQHCGFFSFKALY